MIDLSLNKSINSSVRFHCIRILFNSLDLFLVVFIRECCQFAGWPSSPWKITHTTPKQTCKRKKLYLKQTFWIWGGGGGLLYKEDRGAHQNFWKELPRFQDLVMWVWLEIFFTRKRYQDPVFRAWLEVLFTPKRYQDPVLWAWLEMFFTPKRYQDPVLWVRLEMFFTPRRYQDPVLWAWLEMFFTPTRY